MKIILAQSATIGVPIVVVLGAITAIQAKYTRTGSVVSAFLGFMLGVFVMKTWGAQFTGVIHTVGNMLSGT